MLGRGILDETLVKRKDCHGDNDYASLLSLVSQNLSLFQI